MTIIEQMDDQATRLCGLEKRARYTFAEAVSALQRKGWGRQAAISELKKAGFAPAPGEEDLPVMTDADLDEFVDILG